MRLLANTPLPLILLYKLLGIIQFPLNSDSSFISRFWCLPFYSYFFYISYIYTTYTRNLTGMFKYIDQMAGYTGFLAMLTSMVMFYKRSNDLKTLLRTLEPLQINSIRTKTTNTHQWVRSGLFASITSNILFYPFLPSDVSYYFFCFLPLVVNALDHLFLSDILDDISTKFDQINQNFQRQIKSVDLFVIFPLTKIEKVKNLKQDEVTFNMQKIQELSHLHYKLVRLTVKISGLFEITTITGMIMWFGYVIDTMYLFIHIRSRHEDTNSLIVIYTFNIFFLFFCFYWFLVMVAMFSRTQRHANKTATFVHDIWNKYALKNEVDKRVRHLQLVAIRLLNTRLQFTAKDFFQLDWTFCHMMIAALTTYLVILIQFNF
ncbi:putative gustatory receptor 28b [Tribolium madens]|uniref:putative gustatory receptor 28b n=1 Tax=Tribolium madens TaxID=41895 RepID=UPI001CF755C3|nr:putative gustatory receptor 28b [Tribolium madens]